MTLVPPEHPSLPNAVAAVIRAIATGKREMIAIVHDEIEHARGTAGSETVGETSFVWTAIGSGEFEGRSDRLSGTTKLVSRVPSGPRHQSDRG